MDRPRRRSTRHLSGSENATILASQDAQSGPSRIQYPQRGSPGAGPVHDSSEGEDEPEVEPERVQDTPTEPLRPPTGHNRPPILSISEELQEMRAWLESTQAQEELQTLRELRARYEAGDITAVRAVSSSQGGVAMPPAMPSAALPRPQPPQQFSKRNRAEYNRWERDCEGFFTRSSANFVREQQKVDFGVMYISEPLKTLWRAHCLVEQTVFLAWIPMWASLKTVMFNSLGTPQERRRLAYEQLKSCRQRVGQSLTELLDYLRPLWEELGPTVTPELQVIEYTSALRIEIQRDLERLPVTMRSTIPMIEEQANIIYRRTPSSRDHRDHSGKQKPNRQRTGSDGSEGDGKPLKKLKKLRGYQTGPKRGKRTESSTTQRPITCYNCGQSGHKSFDCTNPAKPGSDPRKEKSGKDQGWKA
jgi:hypothetical protein